MLDPANIASATHIKHLQGSFEAQLRICGEPMPSWAQHMPMFQS